MAVRGLIRLRTAIGLVIDQQQIAMSVVATTPMGRREVASSLREYGAEGPEVALAQMLEPWLPDTRSRKSRAKPWVQIGLPESRTFQAVVPITPSNRMYTPQHFFLEAVQSTNLRAEDRIIELIKIDVGRTQLACISACPCVLVHDQVEILERLGLRIAAMEPGPAGLLRAGLHWFRLSRGSRPSVRIFLGKKKALGMVVAQGQPLFWHGFDLPVGEETKAIMAAYSTLWMLGRHSRIGVPIDVVVIHGRRDLALDIEPEGFRERTGARLVRVSEPQYDLKGTAFGIALNNPLTEPTALNLGRSVRSPISIGDIFPWGELFLQGLLIGGVSLFLLTATLDVETRFKSVENQTKSLPWLTGYDLAKLEGEKAALEQRIRVIDAFRKSRLEWSVQLRTIARDTPESTMITSLLGDAAMEVQGKSGLSKPKKQMVVNFSTPLARDGSMPGEVNELIAKLRAEKVILKDFPSIEMTGVRTASTTTGRDVTYSVVCLPATAPAAKAVAK